MEKIEQAVEQIAEKPQAVDGEESATMSLKRMKTGTDARDEITVKSIIIPPKSSVQEGEEDKQQEKKFPKRKLAMVVGYNGSEFCGSQKQGDVRTVEEVLEKALFEQGMIDHRNYGDLKKIRFTRATRTDKRVHALQNYFAGKLLIDPEKSLETIVDEVNEKLPKDARLFNFINVVGGFDAKHGASYREYDYYMPTFMLSEDVNITYKVPEDDQPEQHLDPENSRSLKRVKIDLDKTNIEAIYGYRITDDKKEILERLLVKFEGTHKFHNYTKQMKSKDKNAQRYMMQIKVLDYRVFDGIEFARVFIKGQSFLYNQIRKMMGAVFMVMHYSLPEIFIENSLKDNEVNVPTAPGEGLMLNRVAYDRYNRDKKRLIKEDIQPWDSKLDEIEQYRVELVKYI